MASCSRSCDCPVASIRAAGRPWRSSLATGGAGRVVRAVKLALAQAFRDDAVVAALVPGAQIFAVERATLPALPAVEVIGISSERVGNGPMIRHESERSRRRSRIRPKTASDEQLDAIVRAVRRRLGDAATSERPIALESREGVLVALGGLSRWSCERQSGRLA